MAASGVPEDGGSGGSPLHEIVAITRSFPSLADRARGRVRQFVHSHPQGRVVTFLDELEGLEPEGAGVRPIVGWRSVLDADVFDDLWRQSYRLTDDLFARVAQNGEMAELKQLFRPYYHAVADRMLHGLVLERLLEDTKVPVLAFVSGPRGAFQRLGRNIGTLEGWKDHLVRAGQRTWFLGDGVLRHVRRRFGANPNMAGPTGAVADAGGSKPSVSGSPGPGGRHFLIAVQEGVAAINSPSAFAVAREMVKNGDVPVLLTHNRTIRQQAEDAGIAVLFPLDVGPGIVRWRWWRFFRRCHLQLDVLAGAHAQNVQAASGLAPSICLAALRREVPLWCALHASGWNMLERYHLEEGAFAAGLLINEGTPASGQALAFLEQKGVAACGYWPALLGNRPDCDHFPAPLHLVYGEQLAGHMRDLGMDASSIRCVGSVNYDRSVGRDPKRDRATVRREILPEWSGTRPLVVVASEALARPFEELGPVFAELAGLDVEIVLKLHPADSRERFAAYLDQRGLAARVRLVERCDLDALLHCADLLICVLSNIIVNAAILGTPTLVCDFSNKRKPMDFTAHGLCLGCFEAALLPDRIAGMLPGGKYRETAVDMLRSGLKAFNSPCDGNSARRVSRILSELAGDGGSFRSTHS